MTTTIPQAVPSDAMLAVEDHRRREAQINRQARQQSESFAKFIANMDAVDLALLSWLNDCFGGRQHIWDGQG